MSDFSFFTHICMFQLCNYFSHITFINKNKYRSTHIDEVLAIITPNLICEGLTSIYICEVGREFRERNSSLISFCTLPIDPFPGEFALSSFPTQFMVSVTHVWLIHDLAHILLLLRFLIYLTRVNLATLSKCEFL